MNLFGCRFVLFKRHYDKYVALAARYEEARGLAYYLEERYHEVKVRQAPCTYREHVYMSVAPVAVVVKELYSYELKRRKSVV